MTLSLKSQTVVFEKVYNWSSWDRLADLIQTSDNGYAMTVTSNDRSMVVKLDSNGDSLWSYVIDPVGGAWESQIIESANSDLIIADKFNGHALLLRLNSSGDLIDSFTYGGGSENNSFTSVIECENGDYIVSERKEQNSGIVPPIVTLRSFTNSGAQNWFQILGDSYYPWDVILTSNNEIITTGVYDWEYETIWLAKYDLLGNNIYSNIYEASYGNQIIETPSGELIASVEGYSVSFGEYNAMKFSPDGTVIWKLYNNNGEDGDSYTICQLKQNLYAVGGEKDHSLAIKTFNGDGDSLGFYTYDSYYSQNALKMVSNEEFLIAGGEIREEDNSMSILILKLTIDSLYTAIKSNDALSLQSKLFAFPNPAKDIIEFVNHSDRHQPVLIEVYDIAGKLRISENFGALRSLRINISYLESGNYYAKVKSSDTTSYCKFIVKR